MAPMKAFIPALAVVAVAYAQSGGNGCGSTRTFTITNAADIGPIATCTTYSGSISVATEVPDLNLGALERLNGDLRVEDFSSINSITANSLEVIDGTFYLHELQNLASLAMPVLTRIDTIDWQSTGPRLLSLSFGEGVQEVRNLSIGDSQLQNFEGINLVTADEVTVYNNGLLTDLTMQLRNTTGAIRIRGNPSGLSVTLDNLRSSGDLLINDVVNVSLRSYESSEGLVSFAQNDFETLSLPNLTEAAGFEVRENSALTNLSIPLLATTGSLNIISNDELTGNISLPALDSITGAGNLTGSFSGVSLPVLNRVLGTFSVVSSEDISSTCDELSELGTAVFAVDPECSSTATSDDGPDPSGTDDSNGGSNGGSSDDDDNGSFFVNPPTQLLYSAFGALVAIVALGL